jgi:hypothetical protein
MAFGQASGPPAPAKQVAELEALVAEQGFASFREARHPLGLTQRQAAGKFTASEATELIERLTARGQVLDTLDAGTAPVAAPVAVDRGRARAEELVTTLDAEVMATELTNRGWCCIPPE